MRGGTTHYFTWDLAKARANVVKHGINFTNAIEVFKDPLAVTIPDDEHSIVDERWVTLGRTVAGKLLVIVHTYSEADSGAINIHLISARGATTRERVAYEEGT